MSMFYISKVIKIKKQTTDNNSPGIGFGSKKDLNIENNFSRIFRSSPRLPARVCNQQRVSAEPGVHQPEVRQPVRGSVRHPGAVRRGGAQPHLQLPPGIHRGPLHLLPPAAAG